MGSWWHDALVRVPASQIRPSLRLLPAEQRDFLRRDQALLVRGIAPTLDGTTDQQEGDPRGPRIERSADIHGLRSVLLIVRCWIYDGRRHRVQGSPGIAG